MLTGAVVEIFILSGLLALVLFGCVCIVWAVRGGPRWVQVIASITRGLGQATRSANRRSGSGSSGDGD